MQICRECGRKLQDDAEYCPECGRWTLVGENKKQKLIKSETDCGNTSHSTYNRNWSGVAQDTLNTAMRVPNKIFYHGMEIMKQKILISILTVLVLIVTILWYVFFRVGTPEETIEEFEKALNHMDIEAVLECCDSTTQETYSAIMDTINSVTDFDVSGMLSFGSVLAQMEGTSMNVDFEVEHIEYQDDENCTVFVKNKLANNDSVQEFPMTLEEREWKLTVFPLNL